MSIDSTNNLEEKKIIKDKPVTSIKYGDIEFSIVDIDRLNLIDSKISELNGFIRNNTGKEQTEDIKDSLYKKSQDMYSDIRNNVLDLNFHFNLTYNEYSFIKFLFKHELEYDVNTIFLARELKDILLESSAVKEDNSDTVLIKLNGTKLTYIYHLISNVKVKGLEDPDSETFAQVLIKIADMSKILNYYDIKLKDYSSHIMDWVSSFQDSVTYELKPE